VVARIDWLFVLYNVSDVLHNDLEVAGVELNHTFLPKVFYSPDRDVQEKAFGVEIANFKLGLDLNPEDEVISIQERGQAGRLLMTPFSRTLGSTHLSQTLMVLACWQAARGEQDRHLCYRASPADITQVLLGVIGRNRGA
jgi:hypothetical protein